MSADRPVRDRRPEYGPGFKSHIGIDDDWLLDNWDKPCIKHKDGTVETGKDIWEQVERRRREKETPEL